MKILLAAPGTGKTTRIKAIVDSEFKAARRILILSFTNATVHDLTESFRDIPEVECHTLHSFALKINHLKDHYVLENKRERPALAKLAHDLNVDFRFICGLLRCITFDAMIAECLAFLRTNPAYGAEQIGVLDLLVVDEYQDFNPTERSLVEQICCFAADTIFLGDDDQSIYGFKDADPDGIIELYNRAEIERIENENKCHRCPDVVVEFATKLITKNKHRIAKRWEKSGKPGNCVMKQFLGQAETNEFIVSEIEKIKNEDPSTSFLVLTSVRYYVDELIALLTDRNIGVVDFWASDIQDEDYFRVWWLRVIFSERKLLNLLFLAKELTPHYKRKLKIILADALRHDFDEATVLALIEPM